LTSLDEGPYGALAEEYYDAKLHPTCFNFNRLSRAFIAKHLIAQCEGRRVLEVGCGESSVAPIWAAAAQPLELLTVSDRSEAMLFHSERWRAHGVEIRVGDAENLVHWAKAADCVVSGLGDPYNTPSFWRQVSELLPPLGVVIFTCPSFEWAARFRGEHPSKLCFAEFLTRSGARVSMPSFVPPLAYQVEMMEESGLVVTDFEAMGRDQLHGDPISPKLESGQLEQSLVCGFLALKPMQPLPHGFRGRSRALLSQQW
jgi:SAM-dependent methyltransferase